MRYLNFWRLYNAETGKFYELEIVKDSCGFWVETPETSYHTKTYEKALHNAFHLIGIYANKGYKKVHHSFTEVTPAYEFQYKLYLKEYGA